VPGDSSPKPGVRTVGRRIRLPSGSSARKDATAGLVLGVQSVPDGLATGILAGVNPLAGLNAYLVGTVTGALLTSSTFMIVQGTGAMAMVISDVPQVHEAADPDRAVFTLAIVTGAVMLAAGILRLGSALRFVSNAVMVGFMNAVGISIALGQIGNLTGYDADGPNRVVRAVNTALSPSAVDWPSVLVGLITILLIIALERTRLKALGLVVAVIAASAVPALAGWTSVQTLGDLGVDVGGLPTFATPQWSLIPALIVPALSLALVGLVQGAGISATFVNPDGRYPEPSRDFSAQGAANLAAGAFQGMPVGGSVSASLINQAAGAQTRWAGLFAGAVMGVVIVVFGDAAAKLALPSLAGLLILIGIRSVKPADIGAVWRTGTVQKVVFTVTFGLTMVLPLQYAVMVGVGLSVLLHVVRQSSQVAIRRRVVDDEGYVVEVDPPSVLPAHEVVVLQPYGSLFFAAAPVFEQALPSVGESSTGSVVLLRLRGRTDLGSTFLDVLLRYAQSLHDVGSRLMVVSANERIQRQLNVTGVTAVIGPTSIYEEDDRVGLAMSRAGRDADAWVAANDPSRAGD
jgi:SulP family sulfate permease